MNDMDINQINNNSNPSYTAFPGFYGNNSGNNLLNNQVY